MAVENKEPISEAASEKHKRGRPRVIPNWAEEMVGQFYDVRTQRGKQDVYYRQHAVDVLSRDARFAWVADQAKMIAGEAHSWKPSILAELGRIWDDENLKAAALRICELKPKTKIAIAMIRRARTGKGWKGDALDLANEMIRVLNDYLKRHPSTSWKDTEAAVLTVLEKVGEERQKE